MTPSIKYAKIEISCTQGRIMGVYLNPNNTNFLQQTKELYIDKTMMIEEINRRINSPSFKFICISRPRRFGKSIAEDMLSAYYSKGANSRELFAQYKIASTDSFEKNLNKYNVIKIDLNALYGTYLGLTEEEQRGNSFVSFFSQKICAEFREAYPDIKFEETALASYIQKVYAKTGETFIIIIDEYDVLIREQVGDEEFKPYLGFLNSLFKNAELKPAISLAYLTGILPIMKDMVQSKLNTFDEYNMLRIGNFTEFTGFTTDEVKSLCSKYGRDFEKCKSWYDGYKMKGTEIYNPQAVLKACITGEFISYWSKTSSYKVVAEKIRMNFAGTKEDVITMMGGDRVDVNVEKYDNTMTGFDSKDEVFTYLIHLGYLAYDEEEQQCYIPNREIYNEWQKAIESDENYAETDKIIKASKILLQDTIAGNEEAVAKALDDAHMHVTSNRNYNNEYALHAAIYLAYIYALNGYIIAKELPTGNGCADIAYIPFDKTKSAIIVELKRNSSPDTALKQIHEKKYFSSLENWQGNVLFVGINYDADSKKHECKIKRFVK